MKKITLTLILFYAFLSLKAQTEIKFNPILLIDNGIQIGAEQVLGKDWGVDTDLFFKNGEFYMTVAAKYYLMPKNKADGFHIGIFTGFANEAVGIGLGFLAGHKIISYRGVLFEFGLGAGRSTASSDLIGYFKLNVGYRIGR